MSDLTYLDQHLADLPDVVDAEKLALKMGCKVETIYQRAWRQRKNPKLNLIPIRLIIPGNNELLFTRAAVVDWLSSAVPTPDSNRGPGRPKGATSRRGIGRDELEART